MPTIKRKEDFFESDEGAEIIRELRLMAADAAYNTRPSYSANAEQHPDHLISFVEKHKNYLQTHPTTNPQQYLSNLRLLTRIR